MNRLTKKDERMVDDVYDCLRNVNKIYNKPLIWKGYKDKFTKFFLENINEDFITQCVQI